MKLTILMALKALLCLVVGIGLVLVPDTVLPWFAITLNAGAIAMARLFGASFLLLAVLLWTIKNVENTQVQRDIVLAVFIGDGVGLIVAALSQLAGAVNELGWIIVAIYLLLTLAFGYFLFFRPVTTIQQVHPAGS
jgi:Ca2+/Na+ antiporter